jgi:hypothetical protein
MAAVSIVVDPSSLTRTASGGVAGKLLLRGEAADFPAADWFDFPLVVLAWWIDGLSKLVSGEAATFQGLFMEGPYAFTLQSETDGFSAISWGVRGKEHPVGTVSLRHLHKEAVEAGAAVARECRTRSWHGADLRELEEVLERAAV